MLEEALRKLRTQVNAFAPLATLRYKSWYNTQRLTTLMGSVDRLTAHIAHIDEVLAQRLLTGVLENRLFNEGKIR